MNIEFEIGNNLRIVMEDVIKNANKGGVSAGLELRKAFNLDINAIASTLGTAEKSIAAGRSLIVNIELPAMKE